VPLYLYWLAVWPAVLPVVLYHLFFTVPALFFLRQRELDPTAQAIWALLIVSIPVVGLIAFAVLQPGRRPLA
jgi:hypothetical protein